MIPGLNPNDVANSLVNDLYNSMYTDIHAYQTIFKFNRPTIPAFKAGLLDKVKQLATLNVTTMRDLFDVGTDEWNFFRDVLIVLPTVTIA